MSYFAHHKALVESDAVGEGTRVWAFAHVLAGAMIGADCNICDGVFVESDVRVGDRVTVKCGVQLWNGVELEDDVFVGPNATFTNDRFPRSRQWGGASGRIIVRQGASLGANCTILPDVEIGEGAMVGAGAVVTKSVPRHAIVAGNPARIMGYVDPSTGARIRPSNSTEQFAEDAGPRTQAKETTVAGVTIHRIPENQDLRGSLTAGEFGDLVPFAPERYFLVYDVPGAEIRGEHAHRECHQFLICAHGTVSVIADDGRAREEFQLTDSRTGVYLPPMTWGIQYRYSADAVLLVFASHPYDADDYIRDYDEFLALADSGTR